MAAKRIAWVERVHGTGHREIDRQHQELFRRIGLLIDALEGNAEDDELDNLLTFLDRYIVEHFQYEEGLMESLGCSQCPLNKLQHDVFRRRYDTLRRAVELRGRNPELVTSLRDLLVDWTGRHVATIDVALRETPAPD